MIVRKFVCKEHREAGYSGWRPSWMPHFDPMEGVGVAHDTLEHLVSDDGTVEAEFKAFGGILWLRGGSGWFAQQGSYYSDVADQLTAEFREQAHYLSSEGRCVRPAPRTKRLSDEWAENAIERCIQKGLRAVRGEDPELARCLDREHIRSYLRIGYRRTARRFADAGPHNMAWIFTSIMNDANRKLKHAEEGDELIVRVEVASRRAHVEILDRDH
jgi:hypothetical protein